MTYTNSNYESCTVVHFVDIFVCNIYLFFVYLVVNAFLPLFPQCSGVSQLQCDLADYSSYCSEFYIRLCGAHA